MLLEQAARHFAQRGWTVEEDLVLGSGRDALQPSLVVSKNGRRQALLVSDDPLGAYQIGVFAARCKRVRIGGVVVCPTTEDVLDACQAARLDYLSPEGLGEGLFVPRAAPSRMAVGEPPSKVAATQTAAAVATSRSAVPLWRWAIVAGIWMGALYYVVRLARLMLG